MTHRLLLFIILAAGFLVASFILWGDFFEGLFLDGKLDKASVTLEAGIMAMLLLWADPLLPIPVTIILASFGAAFGFWVGTILGIIGTFGSGMIAYGLCRLIPEQGSSIVLGKDGVEQGKKLLAQHGGWAIAFSRWMAILPEILSGMAGMLRMPFKLYCAALLCGTVPLSATFVWLGTTDLLAQNPKIGLLMSAILPLGLWWGFKNLNRWK